MPQGGAARALQGENMAEDYGKDGVAGWTEGGSRSPHPCRPHGATFSCVPAGVQLSIHSWGPASWPGHGAPYPCGWSTSQADSAFPSHEVPLQGRRGQTRLTPPHSWRPRDGLHTHKPDAISDKWEDQVQRNALQGTDDPGRGHVRHDSPELRSMCLFL